MKKLLAALLVLSLAGFLQSCKRGEEDPGLSFSSRDNRLAGEWEISSGTWEKKTTLINANPDQTASSTDIAIERYEIGGNGKATINTSREKDGSPVEDPQSFEFDFGLSMTIEKEGSYEYGFTGTERLPSDQYANVEKKASGIWFWMDQDKSKTGIVLMPKTNPESPFSLMEGQFSLKKLSGDEMIMVKSDSYQNKQISSTAVETQIFEETIELTFTKK